MMVDSATDAAELVILTKIKTVKSFALTPGCAAKAVSLAEFFGHFSFFLTFTKSRTG